MALPFGRKHPGAAFIKIQGGLLRLKSPFLDYNNAYLFSDYESTLGLHVGVGAYWTIFAPLALTVNCSTLQGKAAFLMPSTGTAAGLQDVTRNWTSFNAARLGVGLLVWMP